MTLDLTQYVNMINLIWIGISRPMDSTLKMMKTYLTRVFWDAPYPTNKENRIQAGSFASAARRALGQWRKDNPRKQFSKVKIELVRI